MEILKIQHLLAAIQGCTFASLDAQTKPKPGVLCVTTGERVMLFTNKNSSGYDNMVRRRLEQAGFDPSSFILGPLPWGERLENSPIIYHKGEYYLQCITLGGGESKFYVGKYEVDPSAFGIRQSSNSGQGLPKDTQVVVHTYAVKNITRLTLMGETVTDPPRGYRPREGKEANSFSQDKLGG